MTTDPGAQHNPWSIGLSVALLAATGAMVWASHGGDAAAARPGVLGALVALTTVYAGALGAWWRGGWRPSLKVVLGAAIAARVLLACASYPTLSDDVWRYLWDGYVQLEGLNPYTYAPAADEVAGLRTPIWPLINHPEVPTIYPPVAQWVFAAVAAVTGATSQWDAAWMRLVMVAVELGGLGAVWRLAGVGPHDTHKPGWAERRAWLALLVLWSPLMLVEFAGSGHLDALAITPLLWALALTMPVRAADADPDAPQAPLRAAPWALAGACIALSAGAKLLGAVALAPLALWAFWPRGILTGHTDPPPRFAGRLARLGALGAGFALTMALTFAPYLTQAVFDTSGTFSRGLSTYARKWRGNDGAFALIMAAEDAALGTVAARPEFKDRAPYWRFDGLQSTFEAIGMTHVHEGRHVASTSFGQEELGAAVAKALVAMLLAALLGLLLYLHAPPAWTVLWVLAALLLFAPTAHPWYIAWLVPMAVALRVRSLQAWGVLVMLIYAESVVGGSTALRTLEYVPVWALIMWELYTRLGQPNPDDRIHPAPTAKGSR